MDSPLSGEHLAAEKAFAKRYLETLAPRKVEYPADYASPLEDRPRRVPVIGIPIAPPPELAQEAAGDATVSLTVKSLKPPLSVTVTAHLSDSVADLKAAVSAASAAAPPPDAQRLLLKGKALADTKLLKEYSLTDGAVVTLFLKPGAAPATITAPPPSAVSPTLKSPVVTRPRAPTLTITTDGDENVPLAFAEPSPEHSPVTSKAFHATASNPEFWDKLHSLVQGEFAAQVDADSVFNTFLNSMKGRLSASEVAKIRDVVGVEGMGA